MRHPNICGRRNRHLQNLLHDINNINYWLKMKKLKLNDSKTKLLQIYTNNNLLIKINNETIEKVDRIKYLAFIIHKDLKLREQIDYIR